MDIIQIGTTQSLGKGNSSPDPGKSPGMKPSQCVSEPVTISEEGEKLSLSVWQRMKSSVRTERTETGSRLGFQALGTWCQIRFDSPSSHAAESFASQAVPWVAAFEAKFARHHPGSLVSRINQLADASWVVLDDEAERLFSICEELGLVTRGAFDPTVLPLTELWMRAGREAIPPTDEEIEQTRQLVGWHQLKRCSGGIFLPQAGMGLDMDVIAQAYATDRLVQFADWHGLSAVMVDFGRNKRYKSRTATPPAWPIQLESTAANGGAWTIQAERSVALSACSGVRRLRSVQGEWDEPVVDPRTGRLPVHGCHDVVVSTAHCTLASALALAACVSGPEKGMALLDSIVGVEGAILTAQGAKTTPGFAIRG